MVKNYISENLSFLIDRERTSKDEFGEKFGLNRGIVSQYIRRISIPKLETIQKICEFYEITLDAFVNSELSLVNKYEQKKEIQNYQEPPDGYGYVSLKYVELLENSVRDKDIIIKSLEEKLEENNDKSKTG